MSLLWAYLALAAVLGLAAGLLGLAPALLLRLPRSTTAGLALGLSAVALLGWHLWNLPEPDLAGFPRAPVTAVFVLSGLAAFVWKPDLIAVRGLGALLLFLGRATLDAGWGRLPDSLLCSILTYALLVVPGLVWAASPGRLVRLLERFEARSGLRRALAATLAVLALLALAQGLALPA